MNLQVKGFLTDALLDQPLWSILVRRRYQSVYDESFLSAVRVENGHKHSVRLCRCGTKQPSKAWVQCTIDLTLLCAAP